MRDRVQEAIDRIEKNDWVEVLRQCPSLIERLNKLMKLLPETHLWGPIHARQLVYQLFQKYSLDFGVCPHYEMEGDRQYCTIREERLECLCAIPEAYCVFRDKDGKPKYPEFSFIRLLEAMEG